MIQFDLGGQESLTNYNHILLNFGAIKRKIESPQECDYLRYEVYFLHYKNKKVKLNDL